MPPRPEPLPAGRWAGADIDATFTGVIPMTVPSPPPDHGAGRPIERLAGGPA